MPQTSSLEPTGLSAEQKTRVDALMDYIATTPQNINYNIVREISKAVILNEKHPYFDYYNEKIESKKISSNSPTDPPEVVELMTTQ